MVEHRSVITWLDEDPDPICLRPPRHRIEQRAIVWWTLRSLLGIAGYVGLPLAAFLIAERFWPWLADHRPWALGAATALAALFALYAVVVPVWRYAVHRWEANEAAVYARSGWFIRQWKVAPLARVQTVDTTRGPLEQLLGLSTLVVTTASSYGPVAIPGLNHEVASEAAQYISELTQAIPGDAT
ncbi:hypothetical protein HNR23_004408 [Nocardiopsis mwathae]|uniref:YdbS-like PH domain-containing protein n=1 Tax=Nocardiopsis mwathae TaxID=1472723 RepID=A0A7X0D7D7_9ACTN|nr:PH domain-containing protein [Nocardiopsis mwathae]MBB6174348.1 hypothetical protein [Nocardiopsis mwathae]